MRHANRLFLCVFAVVLTVILCTGAGAAIKLADKDMVVYISEVTGAVESISDAKGVKFLAGGMDKYVLDEKESVESDDAVLSKKAAQDSVTLECSNSKLRMKIRKFYQLKGNMLQKVVRYSGGNPDKQLMKVSSASTIDPGMYKDGFYYTVINDGYTVLTEPYIPGTDIVSPIPWIISTGNFIYYSPKRSQLLAHYRYKINGEYVLGEVDRNVESKYVPGGAITAIGMCFIGGDASFTLESRYLLINGDPRDYHKQLVSEPPYTKYKNAKVPEWFKHTRMFFGDGRKGTGRGLVEEREEVAKDILNYLKIMPEDENLMVFFNHWSTSGDYPYKGTLRYLMYDGTSNWSEPVPVETVKENIKWLKSLSPRIKVGGYIFFAPAAGTYPFEQHKEWLIHNKAGQLEAGGDGIGLCGVPDFSTGYREYILDQLKHAVTDLGFDWLHLDTAVFEIANYGTKNVAQSSETIKFYDALSEFLVAHDAALVENVAWTTALWSQGGYLECQQPDRWEKKNWRILGVNGYLTALYRTNHPDTWVNLCYGSSNAYGLRNSYSGMRGWMRGALLWWREVSHSLEHENINEELFKTTISDVEVYPSWWKMETEKLEVEAFRAGQGLVIPVILHDDKAAEEKISIKTAQLKLIKNNYLFSIDMKLSPSVPLDAFKPVPWTMDNIELIGFGAVKDPGQKYTHSMKLEPRQNYYHLLTQVPAWVYSFNGRRASLLLPENRDVKISGALPIGAKSYTLTAVSANKAAQIIAYIPGDWKGATVKVNGKQSAASTMSILGKKCLLIGIGKGKSDIVVTASNAPSGKVIAYTNPQQRTWEQSAQRVFYYGVEHRAYTENGMSCLALKQTPGGAGLAEFPMVPSEKAGGFSLKVKGENSGGNISIAQFAGDSWTYQIKDDFTGWKEFNVRKEQMTTAGKDKKWDVTGRLSIQISPVGGKEVNIADIKLLPAKPGDLPDDTIVKKRTVAVRTSTPPVIDGQIGDKCWEKVPVATDFYGYSGAAISDSKTNVKVCYDDENMYVLFENIESLDSVGKPQARDTQIWNTDHVELFIDPYMDSTNWLHLLVDPAGTIQDERAGMSGRDGSWNGDFEVKTYLNWKASWYAEYKVPFKMLGKTPKNGDIWGLNFARKDLSGEWSNWATYGDWLDPAGFGEVLFASEGAVIPAQSSNPVSEADILMYCSFDGSPKPEVQKGDKGFDAQSALQFQAGHKGQALVTAHTKGVTYKPKGNILPSEGTIKFWVMPVDWNGNQQIFHHFVCVPGSGSSQAVGSVPFDILLYKFAEWDEMLAYGMNNELTGPNMIKVTMDNKWRPNTWHMVVFTWDSKGAQLFVDGTFDGRKYSGKAPDTIVADYIQVGGPYFGANDTLTAIDELYILKRKLSEAEIKTLYKLESDAFGK